jgi:hypothetical protein
VATEAERLTREILHTRERLGENVDALVDRIHPRRVAAREAARMRSATAEHSTAVMLIGAGVGVMALTWLVWKLRH